MGVKLFSQESRGREEATLKQWLIDNQIGMKHRETHVPTILTLI